MSTEHADDQKPAEETQATEATEADPSAEEETPEPQGDEQDAGDGEVGKLRREAASYRTRARDAEARADTAEAQRDAVLAHLVSEVTGRSGISAEALTAAEVDRTAWFSEDGALDLDRVRADVEAVRTRFGLPRLGHNPHTGTGTATQTTPTWTTALKG